MPLLSLRVVHIVYSFGIGGLEKGITTIINHGSSDIEHIIISLCGKRDSERLLQKAAQIYCLEKPQGNSFEFFLKLIRLLKSIRPDIVHTRNWSGMDGILAARLAGVKIIVHGEHGWDMLDPAGSNKKRRWIRKLTSPMVSQYICVSKQLARWLKYEVGINKPVCRICNGVDTVKFKPADSVEKCVVKKEMGALPSDFVVGMVARLDAIKNHRALVAAFNQVATSRPDVKLVVVGDGPEADTLKSRTVTNVRFLGYRSDTARLMQGFDLFVLPSFNEGISNTILEAMATGLPVIASDVGGNPELVQNNVNGFLVDPYDIDCIAEAITEYIKHSDKIAQHGQNGRSLAEKKFSVKAMVNLYEGVYRSFAI